jgi:glycosyltransferase involved in cell wall biosynthesis
MTPETKTIKICFVAPKAYPLFNHEVKAVFGGAEMDLYLIATELAKDRNFAVSFITADYGQDRIETIAGVKIIRSLDFKKNRLNGTIRVWQAMHTADAQIYFQEAASWGTLLVVMYCRSHNRRFVYRTANQRECDGTYLKKNFLAGKAFLWSLQHASQVLVQNETDKEAIRQTLGVSATVIPSGQNLPLQRSVTRDTILWVGRSARIKRPELFIELAEITPSEHFTMICRRATGDQKYEELVDRAKKVKNLQFLKRVEFDEMEDNFQRAKLFVCTSKGEGFPNTYVEACKHATPILSLSVNPDNFLNRFNCGICAGDDWERFLSQLGVLLDPRKRDQYGKNARQYAEQNHNIEKVVQKYKDIFSRLVPSG